LRKRSWRASRITASDKSLASRASLSGMARGYTQPKKLGRPTGKRRTRVCDRNRFGAPGQATPRPASRPRANAVTVNAATKPPARHPHLARSCPDRGRQAGASSSRRCRSPGTPPSDRRSAHSRPLPDRTLSDPGPRALS
jgi:hypothetical protein